MGEDTVRKWMWVYASSEGWKDLSVRLNWLDGKLSEMVKEFGGYSDVPMIEIETTNSTVIVYSLDCPIIPEDCKADVHRARSMDEIEDGSSDGEISQWINSDTDPRGWYYFFEPVYPSTHLVFVHYQVSRECIEVYGIFCASYFDMINVVGKLNAAHGVVNV